MSPWLRRVAPAALLPALLPLLSGCTVPVAGITGVSVTPDGKPVGVILVCHDQVDAAVFYPAPPDTGDDTTDEAEPGPEPEYEDVWTSAEAVTGFTSWPLTEAGGNGWTPKTPPHALEEGQVYTLYGATRDASWSTASHSFTPADLKELTPDRVSYTLVDEDGERVRTTTLADFRAHACKGF
ncbi:hypothetical protein ACFW2Y_35385 [Streptomyces sp. NPDC058877]|uniref:hypothetical protein n=1 Tax=unclassified Streptomyces TaxID=2593676 RepID=UPI0036973538